MKCKKNYYGLSSDSKPDAQNAEQNQHNELDVKLAVNFRGCRLCLHRPM